MSESQLGAVLRTSDGGENWETAAGGDTVTRFGDLRSVCFTDARSGFLCGDSIYRTSDGGTTWTSLAAPVGPDTKYISVSVAGSSGWLVRSDGTVLSSTDAGASWQTVRSGAPGDSMRSVHVFDGSSVIVAGSTATSPATFATTDGGAHWDVHEMTTDNDEGMTAITFVDRYNGWMTDSTGLFRTRNGGTTWDFLGDTIIPFASPARVIHFRDTLRGWMVGDLGMVLRTYDGGAHWDVHEMTTDNDEGMTAITFVDRYNGWMTDSSGLFRTRNGGTTWDFLGDTIIPFASPARVIHFRDTLRGWMVGDLGMVLRTYDGGWTWEYARCQQEARHWYGMSVVQDSLIWIAGTDAGIAHTVDTIAGPLRVAERPRSPILARINSYPNPFSERTTIEFDAPAAASTLRVYDMLGRQVADLTSLLYASGHGERVTIPFDAASLPRGAYVAVVRSASGVATARLSVVR
jgi:photosystem II stability/assembly factor-like uncharacterized protein